MTDHRPIEVVVAGAGVAGVETILGMHELAADRVRLTLLDPEADFRFRPMTVAEPFGRGHARRYPLADVARAAGARHVRAGLAAVDAERHVVRTSDGDELPYDALVLAVGAGTAPAFPRATTFDPDDAVALAGLVRDVEEGYARRVAIVIPSGPHWPLPAYELAFQLARDAAGMGIDDLALTIVTPEAAVLCDFGAAASVAVAAELERCGIAVETAAHAEVRPGHAGRVVLHPSGRTLEVDHVLALPVVTPRRIRGVPCGADGFVAVDELGRVLDMSDVYAAGDGTSFRIKQGGLAAQQADVVVAQLARRAGVDVPAHPFRPVLRGRLLTADGERWMRHSLLGHDGDGQIASHCLWWPPDKIAGRFLAPYLAARDEAAGLNGHAAGAHGPAGRPLDAWNVEFLGTRP